MFTKSDTRGKTVTGPNYRGCW